MNRKVTETYPLSYGQQALWFIYQMAPENVAYNIFITVKINSYINNDTFINVWNKIVECHPILRTTYTTHQDKPVQRVNDQHKFKVEVIDASDWNEDKLKEKIFEETDRPFNLETDSVLRIHLFTRSAKEHTLLLTMHHIAGDMWSFDLLLSEFQALYTTEIESANQEQAESVESSPIRNKSYIEFVRWQSEMLSDERREKYWEYWKKQLADELPILNLLADKPRPPVQTYQGASHLLRLDEQLIHKLNNLAVTSGTSLYQILLTAFYIQLYRYTNQKDILIGSPMRGRWGREFKEIIGYFVNLIVLRVSIGENATFEELNAQVGKTVRQAQKHQDYPFSLLVEQLQQQRDPSRPPLCQVSLTWQRHRWCESTDNSLPEREQVLKMEPYLLGHQRGADFDLNLTVMEAQGVMQLCWQYNTDLFEATTIARMSGHFVTLLEAIVANPQQQISQLPLLTEVEARQLLVEWNDTQTDYPQDKCLHQLFEEQCLRSPDAVAVVFEKQQLTYRELNNRANQLAYYLRSLGVGADILVGICVERSIEMVVGILGILKAGGAYVPLDPKYPQERIQFMLEDASVPVLLTQAHLVDKLPEQHKTHFVYLDTDVPELVQSQEIPHICEAKPSNLAYVLYTSGSTGRPKAVAIEHHSPVALVSWAAEVFTIEQLAGVLASTSICFDLSIFELFVPLSLGGKVILAENALHFSTITTAEQVTLINTVPSAIAQLIRQNNLPEQVNTVNLAGEALQNQLVQQIYQQSQVEQIFNLYGPSEDTTYSTFARVKKGATDSPPIGRPIANTQVYILDSYLQPVPIGVPGELHIGGVGLARGYLNARELTQEKFIPNPFSNQPFSRLYKTGDLARYLPDGNIEYLGRIDHQVKIRGFRIELGEIEAVLHQHPQIQTSVVIARVDNSTEKRLVAYLVSDSEVTPTIRELREYLKAKLPEYMVPSAFVFLETLPLTPNGKIDRRALPALLFDNAPTENYVAPRTPREEILTHLFSQVLKLNLVGINDNFFELGGHSLLATQLISRIRTHLQVELPLTILFSAPTVAKLASHIQQLEQQNLQLNFPPIVKRANESDLPLSYAQQRLWFIDQFQPNSALYNIPLAWHLKGTLSKIAFEQSLNEIVQRHEILRTNFININGQPSQVIHAENPRFLAIVDLQHLGTNEQEIAVQEIMQEQTNQPFELAFDSLIRITLIKLSETEHILIICMHHIISDGWSMGPFAEELATLYDANTQGKLNPLTPLPIQYTDFAGWQQKWLQGEFLQTQLNYWKQQLADAPALLSLPTDRARPSVQTFTGEHPKCVIPLELTQKLTQLSQKQGVTLFMTLLAAFNTLLYRYTGQLDILVGSPIANRNHNEIEGLIGFFVNILVLRTDLSENPSFTELLHRTREVSLAAYTHQDLPFEMLVKELQPERDLSLTPLFQVMFTLHNTPGAALELTGLSVSSIPVEIKTAKYDLSLTLEHTNQGLSGVWEYNTDLFDRTTIEGMTGHFVTLLESIVAHPEQQISQLPLLREIEQKQLLIEWNNTQTDYPSDKCIHQLFEAQVERTPDAIAVGFEKQQLTYRDLNNRANQLAHYLRSLGVKADTLVGLCVERSLLMLVGILGILKAGGAYVPLDSEYPTERLSFMLEDSQVSVLLTQQQFVETLHTTSLPKHQAQVVCLDTDWNTIAQNSESNPQQTTTPNNLAYVIYTSGSTGKPKGVLVNHCNVVRLFAATNDWYNFNAQDVWTLFHSYAFDFSVWEIWGALLYGGRLVIVPYFVTRSPESFYQLLVNEKVTVLNQTPSAFRQLIFAEESITTGVDLKLRLVIFGGEALELKSLQPWFERHGDRVPQLVNMYGITETTVHVTYRPLSLADLNGVASVIGRAIPDLKVYVLDQHLQPVPIGVRGEMYVGGAGVTRGYLNRDELTAQRFISSFFDDSKLYKTGDLARYLPNGELEYLGRIDHQVKIRGFRIELGEIEAALAQHPAIRENVVVVREDEPGDKRLVAYVVAKGESSLQVIELRQFLTERLPNYMVPNAIVVLESLPLTANGKVDRRALPKPDLNSQPLDKYVAPRTPVEEILAQIWSQVLKVERVGINDNFFELGGHSLLATQLVSRIRSIFQTELPLRNLFAAPTVAEQAQLIGKIQQQNLELTSPPILPRAKEAESPLSYAQQRLWFLDQLELNRALYNIPLALRLEGNLNIAALEQSLQEIIARHEALRTNFISIDGQATQVIHQTTTETLLSVINLKHLSPKEQETTAEKLIQQQAIQPLDLASETLIKTTLILLSETEQILLVLMHHIVSDGWSMGVFVQELNTLYKAYTQGQPSPLTPLMIQYADYAIWQRQWLQGEVLENQLKYWQQQLANAPSFLPLPTDRPRPAVPSFTGAHQEIVFAKDLTEKLTQLSQEQGVTLFMTLLAAFNTLLYRYTGQTEILVGSPIANRNHREIEELIGFFVNTLVMRTELSGNPSFSELLIRVREMALSAYAHQDLPFEMLVEALQPERDLSHTPLFQVMFTLQNTPVSTLELTGLSLSSIPVATQTAKFDLTLALEHTNQGLRGVWEYNTDLFDRTTIEGMTGHFVTLLESIVAHPEQQISQLPLLREIEQKQLLIEWNNTQTDYPSDKCIHQLFEAQVERTPDAIAVGFEKQQLTYRDLNNRANQLAHYLRSLGVKADTLVGLCVERSLLMLVGILGILKAGGAYVPLDSEYPTERLSFMLEDSQVSVLLTQQQFVETLHTTSLPKHQAQVVCLDTDWNTIAQNSESNPQQTTTPNNLAYVIYTSGSTGKPKGVLVNHCNVVRLFAATNDWYNFNAQDVWTLFHSYAFDFSVWEIWGALLYGGRLVIVPYFVTRSPESFYQLLINEKVTVLNQTPSAFRQLIQAEESITTGVDLKLRLVIFGGEALELKSLQPWFERHGDRVPQLVNMYGITETTVHVTYRPLSLADLNGVASVIGRAIPDLKVYVLDQHLQPVPIGVRGEMYVGGAGVTRGYLNRDELTAQRFISSFFDDAKLYKTGDVARYLPNGELEYLGRIDNQVKIRGFRIELGEIEAALASHPAIRENVVVVREDEPGDKRLVAYAVAKWESSLQVVELRQFLTEQLPNYMVPNAIVMLDSLPLTANGKVDRRALPKPDLNSQPLDKYVAPRSPTEERLAEIWAEVLKVERVGVNDNFFALGGHSLLATQLVSRIRDRFKIELRLRELFNTATLAELAEAIRLRHADANEKLQQQKPENSNVNIRRIVPRSKR
jgi:amino acid adenylation domain-containing protein